MNVNKACELLDLTFPFTDEQVRIQYKKKALLFHPDKNKEKDATKQFQQINEAATFLLNEYYPEKTIDEDIHMSYEQGIYSFLNIKYPIIKHILIRILEKKTLESVKRFDGDTLLMLYKILNEYKDIFYLSDHFINSFYELYKNTQNKNIFILKPSLDDLFNHSIYKWEYSNEHIFCVPLWHHELIFDASNTNVYVSCIPDLSNNMWIDSYNNLHVEISERIQTIFEINGNWTVWRDLIVDTNTLLITKKQIIPFYNKGIPDINIRNVYDDSKKCHVFVHLLLC